MKDWEYKTAQDLDLAAADACKSVRREIGLFGVFIGLVKRPLLHVYLRLFHRIQILGKEHIPEQYPFVLVANHCSHLDTPILSSLVPLPLSFRLFPIAAGDTFFESYGSSLFAALFINALPLWRKKVGAHSLAQFRNRLVEEPCGYILFPEGTRSRTGQIGKFKPGIGKIVVGQDVPIVPCHIEGAYEAFSSNARSIKPVKITVRIGKPLNVGSLENNKRGWIEASESLQRKVEELASSETQAS